MRHKNIIYAYAKENENVKKPIESIIKSNNQIHKTETKMNRESACMCIQIHIIINEFCAIFFILKGLPEKLELREIYVWRSEYANASKRRYIILCIWFLYSNGNAFQLLRERGSL